MRIPAITIRKALQGGLALLTAIGATYALAQTEPAPSPNASHPQVIDDLPANYAASLDAATRKQVERGRYVARLGDCVACHTGTDKSRPMAGGLALETPFGTLHSTNITPDPETGIGSGLSSGAVGLRLRYEFSRQFAPYIGIERSQSFGNTANMVRASGGRSGETRFVAGVRMWF